MVKIMKAIDLLEINTSLPLIFKLLQRAGDESQDSMTKINLSNFIGKFKFPYLE